MLYSWQATEGAAQTFDEHRVRLQLRSSKAEANGPALVLYLPAPETGLEGERAECRVLKVTGWVEFRAERIPNDAKHDPADVDYHPANRQ